ncbi:hypothetisches protein [Moorella thermoacetica]|uniref:Antitoxin n=1 Tax=Neomoorella thermoacetica TaxID=1525 RepID=A0A1J5JVQ6_NEOTH|nr:type II toxin-antitoxin system prevent-host-death family antitoxin [Moorella thermoacetica]OIQ09536.1 hypothetisches protein [Moorella thermoacetica]
MEQVGIRKMKTSLSHYIKRVKQGESLIITERGRPVTRLMPAENKIPPNITAMLDKGLASWAGGKPLGANKYLPVQKGRSIASIVEEARR